VIATYVDTSAVLRLVYRSGGCVLAEEALRTHPTSSILARVEARVSTLRRWHGGEISRQRCERVLDLVDSHAFDSMELLALDEAVLTEATGLAERFPLRTLDGLHLASAVLADRRLARRGHKLRFCTADGQQAHAAVTLFGDERVDLLPPAT
jgi:predicted nucleic acid-binding protein